MKNIETINEYEFLEFYNERSFDANCFNDDGSLNKNYNSFKSTGIIASIFDDHWESTYLANKEIIDKYRPDAVVEVQKIIDCANRNLGCSVYVCPHCHDIVFIAHTCKSRFCSSCGYKYKNQRVENILQTAYNCNHRQVVFTIPEQLRNYFFFPFEHRINILFNAVSKTIYSILNESFKKNKKGILKKYVSKIKYSPGFFAFLHTFGRDLKWNPHIHVLLAELKLGSDGSCKTWNFFDYDALSRRFQKILLDLISKDLGKSFDNKKNLLYKKFPNGFYVYAEPKKFKDFKSGVEYVTRYCGRVPISENRIVNYDEDNGLVTFSYIDHKDNKYHETSLNASQFIMILLRHLLPSQFKIIRYYGFYRKKHSIHDKMIPLIKKHSRKFRKDLLKYETSILLAFKRNPYNCPKCDTRMEPVLYIKEK